MSEKLETQDANDSTYSTSIESIEAMDENSQENPEASAESESEFDAKAESSELRIEIAVHDSPLAEESAEASEDIANLVPILEALLLTAAEPLSLSKLAHAFPAEVAPHQKTVQKALVLLAQSCEHRAFMLQEVATGYRLQIKTAYTTVIEQAQQEKAPRYSRAFLETLAIITYHQPVSRGDIEQIRGVSVNTHILKTLLEREWIKIVAYRDLPGKPAVYGTTPHFLNYFNLRSLEELPTLPQMMDIEKLSQRLEVLQENRIVAIEEENKIIATDDESDQDVH